MKSVGLFVLQSGRFARESRWLAQKLEQTLPAAPILGPVEANIPPRLLEAIAAQITFHELFIVAAEPKQFHSMKTQLTGALDFPLYADESVAALQKRHPEDTMFPHGSVLFVTPDARYNGFAMRCGHQHMLVLPLRMDLLQALETKITQYIHRAAQTRTAGSRVIPIFPAAQSNQSVSVDEAFARLGGYTGGAPIVPESIVPLHSLPNADQHLLRQAREITAQLAARRIRSDLLLPQAWADVASFLSECGGGAVTPVFLKEKYAATAQRDMSFLVAHRMRETGCGFCGMITPAAPNEKRLGRSYASITAAGPDQFSRTRRIDLHPSENHAQLLALTYLQLLAEYRSAEEKRAMQRRASRAVAIGLSAALAFTGTAAATNLTGGRVEEMHYSQMLAGEAVAPLEGAMLLESRPSADQGTEDSQNANAFAISGSQELMAAGTSGTLYTVNAIVKKLFAWLLDLLRRLPDLLPDEDTETTTAKHTTTTSKQTTTAKQTTTTASNKPASKGTYSLTVVGYGHGVGMSQEGAKIYGAQGWSYTQILKHYFNASGIAVSTDTTRPSRITHGGVSYSAAEYLARVAYAEIGRCGLVADEAIKAQMVCAYTVAKANGYKTTNTNQVLMPDSQWNSDFCKKFHSGMLALANSVLGKYVSYEGKAASALYSHSCAGYSASAQYAWGGGTPAPYLTGGVPSPEPKEISYPVFTTDDIKSLVRDYNAKYPSKAITLGSDARQWIKVLSTDPYGYVKQVQIGNQILTGGDARNKFFTTSKLRSHNFTVAFTAG